MILRKVLERFEPYSWELSTLEIANQLGLKPDEIHRFDTNVSPYPPSEWLKELSRTLPKLLVNEYPDTSYSETRRLLSEYLRVGPDQIIVTNGADEGLDIVAKTFIDPGSRAILSVPTYSMYRVVVETLGGVVVQIPRVRGFADDYEAMVRRASRLRGVRAVFLCNPNNPTGNLLPSHALTEILGGVECPVILDESYVEFSGGSQVDLTRRWDNLVVVRTMSKAFGLAGARVGYLVVSEATGRHLNKVRPPNSLSVISLALANIALRNIPLMASRVKAIVGERDRLTANLNALGGIQVFRSEANFFLVRFKKISASEAVKRLLRRGIVPRNVSDMPMLKGCLRFSVRSPSENEILLKGMREMLGE